MCKTVRVRRRPYVITFSDASMDAFGACAYVRWKIANGSYETKLVISKTRVAPLKCITIVNLELSAAVLASRLRKFIVNECRYTFERFTHIVDSEIVRSMIQKESYGFNTFAATRIGEIQENTDPSDWVWIDGGENIADIMTRGAKIDELAVCGTWHNGPSFMSKPIKDWPVSNSCASTELPERTRIVLTAVKESVEYLIDISRFSRYNRLIRTTARIISLKNKTPTYSLKNIFVQISPKSFGEAEAYWTIQAQRGIKDDLELALNGKGPYKRLNLEKRKDGIFVVGRRVPEWNEMSYNKRGVPLLPKEHPISKLFVDHIHNLDHLGVSSTVAKVRTQFWILSVERIAKGIRHNCVPCRKRDARSSSQVMSPLPIDRLKPAPAWTYTGIDLCGPFLVKGEVNKRTSGKCYGIIFTCLLVRAVHLEVAPNYSTDRFLMAFRRFTSIRGFPNRIYSDGGSQLVGASSELKIVHSNLDWNNIKSCGSDMNLEWVFSPGDSPWYNGCCEALVKSVKKSIFHSIKNHRVSYSELTTVLYEVASIINERPIGKKPNNTDDGAYLCPNDLLLGRSSRKLIYQELEYSSNIKKRHHFIQQLADAFWRKWTVFYFPSLVIQPKWHHEKRDMLVGDIVIIQDSKLPRGKWKLGCISEVISGMDKRIRRVTVKYRNDNSKSFTFVQRPVQRLIVIVPFDTMADM